MTTTILLL